MLVFIQIAYINVTFFSHKMSRIRRNAVRRDRAYTLLAKIESDCSDLLPTHMEPKLLAILKDIPSTKFQSTSSPEWETYEVVFQAAQRLGIVPSETVEEMELSHFRLQWERVRNNKSSKLIDFLNVTQSFV